MGHAGTAAATTTAAKGSTCGAQPRARADAARNRERILIAAREAFVVNGADASLDEIARCAGVGNATLYRHFPDRDALVHGVVDFVTGKVADRAELALKEEDSFEALRSFVRGAAEERVGALCPMLSGGFDPSDPQCLEARMRVETLAQDLIQRGQREGKVRTDIDVGDVLVALSQLTRPLPGLACRRIERFAERHVQLFLDGLRAPAKSELPGHAATLEALRQEN
ncbi:TetR/AcrR family transcriptional regulator [Streptomyces iconiensis]|uniref:TetR/AcrR family transcriptional regulator n=1 Tax=Streptomyces iconiensis TaxID=1384038 RepID=A0ABT7AB48_9ACTN|nr:TetR/AcrR family transcriptional regulator [Streptomyces iconiensis]MDJ1138555.1 TetR/AcrR family transcriptional regulator [Streptomyces iconiensis]